MAQYSNVGTPAFYIPWFDWRYSIGWIPPVGGMQSDIFFLNPSKAHDIPFNSGDTLRYDFPFIHPVQENGADTESSSGIYGADGFSYVFILGHNFEDRGVSAEIVFSL